MREALQTMKKTDADILLRHLTDICHEISRGRYTKAKQLFELTKTGDYPRPVAELAEVFGMMMVKLEAREFHLEQTIGSLKKTETDLKAAKDNLVKENRSLKQTFRRSFSTSTLLGTSKQMIDVAQKIDKLSLSSTNVLITGETGTGKELAAKTMHYNSSRSDKPFIVLNCSAIPETLFESEMFGIEKGIATGVNKRIGKIEQADHGTLFLDEIGDMPLTSQTKMLRVIEDHILDRVGGRTPIPVDIRIIAATNKNLKKAVKEGAFREDLYYRLSVVNLDIPPLRERKSDIILLANFFLDQYTKKFGVMPRKFSSEVIRLFNTYTWPGNVRELKNEVERAVVLSTSNVIGASDISEHIKSGPKPELAGIRQTTIKEGEAAIIQNALTSAGGNKSEAARILGISREGLRKKMKRLKLS